MDCIFCKIIDRTIPGYIIAEDDVLITFLSLENHPLIVSKRHIADIFSLDEETSSAVAKQSVKIASAMKKVLECDGIYVTQANGASAGQDVLHYHMHLYPKWESNKKLGTGESDRKAVAEMLKKDLG